MMTNIEQLKEKIHKLNSLLNDPHPGLITWQTMTRTASNDLENLLREIRTNEPDKKARK